MAGMNYHYYDENDPYAAQWLRNLMAAGFIEAFLEAAP